MKKVRWGIVGPGNIANKFAKAIKNIECAELVAVASRNFERGEEFAKKYAIPKIFCGYEEMAKSDIVDAVYIATPHPFHKPCAEIFLNNKKHVLCEKPLCVNAYQARKLKECAEKNGVFLMEAMWTRFLPAINKAKELVESGYIGDVGGLEADFCYRELPETEEKIYLNEMAGGSLLDVGVYGLHFAAIFLGNNPQNIVSVANIDNGVDIHTSAVLKYKNGAIANITSAIGLQKPASAYIYGTKGYIYFPSFYSATEFFVSTSNGTERIECRSIGDGFEEEIIESCTCIINGKNQSDILPLDETIVILEQMDSIRSQIGLQYPFDKQ